LENELNVDHRLFSLLEGSGGGFLSEIEQIVNRTVDVCWDWWWWLSQCVLLEDGVDASFVSGGRSSVIV
jgi:hypothetical protein